MIFLALGISLSASPQSFADITVKHLEGDKMTCSIWLSDLKLEEKIVKHLGKEESRLTLFIEEGEIDHQKIGHPAIPFVEYKILLPYGYSLEEAKPTFRNVEFHNIKTKIDFIPQEITITDYADPIKREQWEQSLTEDNQIYLTNTLYNEIENFYYQQFTTRGYQLVSLKANPIQYNPVTGVLRYSRHIELTLNLKRNPEVTDIADKFVRFDANDEEFIKKLAVNAEEISTYVFPKTRK